MSGRNTWQEQQELGLIKHQPTIRNLRNTTIVDMLGQKLSKSAQVKKKSRTSPSPDPSKYEPNTKEELRFIEVDEL